MAGAHSCYAHITWGTLSEFHTVHYAYTRHKTPSALALSASTAQPASADRQAVHRTAHHTTLSRFTGSDAIRARMNEYQKLTLRWA